MWFLFNLLLFVLFDYVLAIIHEFGHAFVAKALRFKVFSIRVGHGRRLFKINLFGIPLIVNTLPLLGLTLASPLSTNWVRLRLWLYVLAGPAIHFVFLVLCYVYSPDSFYLGYVLPKVFSQGAPLEAFVIANLVLLAINVFPRRIKNPLGEFFTDGYQLFSIPFLKQELICDLEKSRPRIEAYELMREGEFEQAITIYCNELAVRPNDNFLRHDLAIANLQNGRYEEARNLFMELLSTEEFTKPEAHHLLLNNIAWINAVLGRADLIEQADEFSTKALESAPTFTLFVGTRGTVLIRMGRHKDGIELLKKAYKQQSDPDARASEASFIAIGEAYQGNLDAARKWLEKARRESPNCHLIEMARREVEDALVHPEQVEKVLS